MTEESSAKRYRLDPKQFEDAESEFITPSPGTFEHKVPFDVQHYIGSFLPGQDKMKRAQASQFQKQTLDVDRKIAQANFDEIRQELVDLLSGENYDDKRQISLVKEKLINSLVDFPDPFTQVQAFRQLIGETDDTQVYMSLPPPVRKILRQHGYKLEFGPHLITLSDIDNAGEYFVVNASPQLLRKVFRYVPKHRLQESMMMNHLSKRGETGKELINMVTKDTGMKRAQDFRIWLQKHNIQGPLYQEVTRAWDKYWDKYYQDTDSSDIDSESDDEL